MGYEKIKVKEKMYDEKKKVKPLFSCEKFKLLKVIGEKKVQVVSQTTDQLDYPVKEILKVTFDLVNTTDHAFTDKVVKQGIIRKKIVYCDNCDIVRCQFIDLPFTAVAEIPGVDPSLELEFQNKLVVAETDFTLIDEQTLDEKIVLEILIKVSTWVQKNLRVCNTNVINHYQVSR